MSLSLLSRYAFFGLCLLLTGVAALLLADGRSGWIVLGIAGALSLLGLRDLLRNVTRSCATTR